MIEPAVVEIVRSHSRRDADQSFRLFGGCQELGHALIREAIHADAAARFWPHAQPSDRFSAIAPLVPEGVKIASGIAASANILDDDVVAMAGETPWGGVEDVWREGAAPRG